MSTGMCFTTSRIPQVVPTVGYPASFDKMALSTSAVSWRMLSAAYLFSNNCIVLRIERMEGIPGTRFGYRLLQFRMPRTAGGSLSASLPGSHVCDYRCRKQYLHGHAPAGVDVLQSTQASQIGTNNLYKMELAAAGSLFGAESGAAVSRMLSPVRPAIPDLLTSACTMKARTYPMSQGVQTHGRRRGKD